MTARREMTEIKIIVDEYGGKDVGHGRAIAKSKNPSWIAEVNGRFPGMPTQPLAGEKVRSVVSWACRRTSMIACEFGNFNSPTRHSVIRARLDLFRRTYASVIRTANWRTDTGLRKGIKSVVYGSNHISA